MLTKLTFLLPMVILCSALVIPISKVASPALIPSDALGASNLLDREGGNSFGGLSIKISFSQILFNAMSQITKLIGQFLDSLERAHPIDPALILARDGGSEGSLIDLDANVELSSLNGLLGNILCLLSGLLGSILKAPPIEPALLLARDGGSEGILIDLNANVGLSGLNGLLSNILCLLSGLLGSILKAHPIDSALMLARSGVSGSLIDVDADVDLNGLNGLLSQILCLVSSLLGGILKAHPIDPAHILARNGGSEGGLIDVDADVDLSGLNSILANIICLLSGVLDGILKTHPINEAVLLRSRSLAGSLGEDSDKVPLVDLKLLLKLEDLLRATADAEISGDNGLLEVNLEAILEDLLAIIVCINIKGHPLSLAAAELGRKIIDGIAEKNVAKANEVPQSGDNLMRVHNAVNEADVNLVRLSKN